MSQIVLICPHCNMRLGTASVPAAGTLLTCPTCRGQFAAPHAGPAPAAPAPPCPAPPAMRPPPKPPQIQKPPAPLPQFAPLQQPAYVPPTYPAYQSPPAYGQNFGHSPAEAGSSKGLIIGLSVAGGGLALLVILGAVAVFAFTRGGTSVAQGPAIPASGSGPSAPSGSAAPGLIASSPAAPFAATPTGGNAVSRSPSSAQTQPWHTTGSRTRTMTTTMCSTRQSTTIAPRIRGLPPTSTIQSRRSAWPA